MVLPQTNVLIPHCAMPKIIYYFFVTLFPFLNAHNSKLLQGIAVKKSIIFTVYKLHNVLQKTEDICLYTGHFFQNFRF